MKKKHFAEYIDEIDRIAKEARIRQDLASITLKKAEEKFNKDLKNPNLSITRKNASREEFSEAEAAYRKEVESIRVDMENNFRVMREDLKKDVYEYVGANPDRVDQNAVALLSNGVVNDADLVSMSNKYWNNPTMLKLIAKHANDIQSRTASMIRLKISTYVSPDTRLNLYDQSVKIAMRTVQHDGGISGSLQKSWDNEWHEKLRAAMAETDTFSVEV